MGDAGCSGEHLNYEIMVKRGQSTLLKVRGQPKKSEFQRRHPARDLQKFWRNLSKPAGCI